MQRWLGWFIICVLIVGSAATGMLAARMVNASEEKLGSQVKKEPPEKEQREKMVYALLTSGPLPAAKVKLEPHHTPEGWDVSIQAELEDGKLETLLTSASGLFRTLAGTRVPIKHVEAVFRTSAFKDAYGKPLQDLQIARIGFQQETWRKIDWTAFDPVNFPLVADEYWLHELLKVQPMPKPQPDNAAQAGQQAGQQEKGS